ncbi:hypothetical protein NEUTE2DRAFT_100171 [Neurospora tetrasperma FGSC 2509]|nr:hypothetical protein NEUTE2DRAFT_100171 [Neurospora tetrasperma FGSC 2509]
MEPVPETERMEEFRPSPLPSLRVNAPEFDYLRKPPTLRRSTDPSPASPTSPSWSTPTLPYRPRASSPLSTLHVRSRSAVNLAPPMARTQSMPGVNGSVTSTARLRRPSSPLRLVHHASTTSLSSVPSTPSSVASSPSYRAHDSFSSNYYTTSMPSTPTSMRSRSPSISSLETIPDTPDAEEAALEAERIAQLKAEAEAAESGGDTKSKANADALSRGRTLGFVSRDKRKRWSVCGAERRQDLDLETIWED